MIQKFIIFSFYFLSSSLLSFAQIENDSIASALPPNIEIQFQTRFFEGIKQKNIENYSNAIDSFLECLKLFPDRAVVFFQLGDLYFKTNAFDRSESYLRKAIDLDNNNFWYKEKLYQLYIDFKEYGKAIEALKPLLHKDVGYKNDLIHLHKTIGEFDKALILIEEMDKHFGNTPERDQIRIDIYNQTKNDKDYIAFLRSRLEASPNNPNNFLNLIQALSQYNRASEAFKTAEDFLNTHPKSHIVHVALYKFYLESGQYDKAVSAMKIVTESNVLEPFLKLKVLKDFMKFVEQNPQYQSVLLDLNPAASLDESNRSNMEWAQFYYRQNQPQKAISFFEKALSESPNDIEAIKTLAQLYWQTQQYQLATSFSEKQLDFYPTQIELYVIYGQSLMALNRPNEAIDRLELGLDFISEESEWTLSYYKIMVDIYTQTNNITKAKTFETKIKSLPLK